MIWMLVKALISAVVIVAVAEISGRVPRLGALLVDPSARQYSCIHHGMEQKP